MRIKLSASETVDTDDWSIVQLEALLAQVVEQCEQIRDKRQQSRLKLATEGEYSDPDWWRRVTLAGKRLNEARNLLIQEIGRRTKAERMASNAQEQIPKHFIKVARDQLPTPIFDQLLAAATKRYDATQKGHEGQSHYLFEADE